MKGASARRVALRHSKTACVVAIADVGEETILLKVRDRNYVPRIKVVRELAAGTEIAHVYDTWTGWSEGMNEHGISLVSSALLVEVDEGEKKTTDGNSGTGQKIREILGAKTMDAAIEIIMGNVVKGCTIISDGNSSVLVEFDGNKDKGGPDPILKHLKKKVVLSRTNHGVFLEGSGYTEDYKGGDDLKSSKERKETSEKVLEEVEEASDIAAAMARSRKKDRKHPNNAIRATDNMFTSTQILMRPEAKTMAVYLVPREVDFLGVENRLPKKREPQINIEVFDFEDWDSENPVPVALEGDLEVFRLFTYGSMMGKPSHPKDVVRSYKAILKGHHRAYNRASQSRGDTLVMGTEKGGEIEGVVHEYPVEIAHRMLGQVDRREGFRTERDRSLNAYTRGHFAVEVKGEDPVWAVAYLSNSKGPSYLKPLTVDQAVKRIESEGSPSQKYLRHIEEALKEYKCKDSYVSDIAKKVGKAQAKKVARRYATRELELHLYDFDGTLFKSPLKPDWWGKKSWWIEPESLGPPCVPLKPGSSWWIGKTVADAKRSISDSNVWAILCTGRADTGSLRYRVAELLKQQGLSFDEVYLSKGGQDAPSMYKVNVMSKILDRFPNIATVQIWEDQNLSKYVRYIESTGRTCIPHPVKVPPHEVECTKEDMERMVEEGWSRWQKVAAEKP